MRQKHSFGRSFIVAVNGIRIFFATERSGKVQLVVSLVVLAAGLVMKISIVEWLFILLSLSAVLVTEMLNTALEKVCNLITEDHHPGIKTIKDMSAGAVLMASFFSVIIGCTIFIPRLWALFFG